MKNNMLEQITGVNFDTEYQTEIDKHNYISIKKWLEEQLFKAKRCIQRVQQVCEVHFEPKNVTRHNEQFYVDVIECDGCITFTLKKRIRFLNGVNEKFSKINRVQFKDFINGNFEYNENDDLIFEFCKKAQIEKLKAVYACRFEREEYIYKRSNILLTIDKDMEIVAMEENMESMPDDNNYRVRLRNFGEKQEPDFDFVKSRILTV